MDQVTPATKLLAHKFTAIEDHVGAPIPRPNDPRLSLVDFCTLRNMVFHDLIGTKNPAFNHSLFAPGGAFLNEVDLFQALLISINVCTYFRHLFQDYDLMPSIAIQGAQEKIDVLAKEILFPAFAELLAAKGLETGSGLELGQTKIEAEMPPHLRFFIKAESDANAPNALPATPFVVHDHFLRAAERRPVDDDKFEVPRYTREKGTQVVAEWLGRTADARLRVTSTVRSRPTNLPHRSPESRTGVPSLAQACRGGYPARTIMSDPAG